MNRLQELKSIYDENINWLNFAELKNGALLTISGLFLQIILDHIDTEWMKWALVCLCSLVLMVSSISFIPFLNSNCCVKCLAKRYYCKKYTDSLNARNIIFYVNIFLSSLESYTEAVNKSITENGDLDCLSKNYIKQIMEISTIASIKYFIFGISMRLFLICAMAFIVFLSFD